MRVSQEPTKLEPREEAEGPATPRIGMTAGHPEVLIGTLRITDGGVRDPVYPATGPTLALVADTATSS